VAQTAVIEQVETTDCCDTGCCGSIVAPSLTESQADEYAEWFKAISDPTRIRILNMLARNPEPVCVYDITDQFPLNQPTISHHLKILRDTCFVTAERRGKFMYYGINRHCLDAFPDAARRIMAA